MRSLWALLPALLLLLRSSEAAASTAALCAPAAGERHPPLAAALRSGRTVFFVQSLAPREGGHALGDVALCAVEAALRATPSRPVVLYMAGLDCGELPAGLHALLRAWPTSLWALPLDIASVLAPVPALAAWHARGAWGGGGGAPDGPTRAAHLSDAVRLALLHQHGGVYLDTDEVLLRGGALETLGARGLGLESPWVFDSAVLAFPARDAFVAAAIADFAASFDASFWGFNGPRLVTRVWAAAQPAATANFTVLPPAALYPLDYADADALFAPPTAATAAALCRAQAVHLWAHITGPALAAAAAACDRASDFSASLLGRVMAGPLRRAVCDSPNTATITTLG